MSFSVIVRGERELALRFDRFPIELHKQLAERIEALTDLLEGRVETETPVRTGRLRSEIRERVFIDQPERVAGYVSVYAPGKPTEYPKAATLEYGTDKPRRIFARALSGRSKVVSRMTRPVHITARRYLRDPIEDIRPEAEAAFAEVLAQMPETG